MMISLAVYKKEKFYTVVTGFNYIHALHELRQLLWMIDSYTVSRYKTNGIFYPYKECSALDFMIPSEFGFDYLNDIHNVELSDLNLILVGYSVELFNKINKKVTLVRYVKTNEDEYAFSVRCDDVVYDLELDLGTLLHSDDFYCLVYSPIYNTAYNIMIPRSLVRLNIEAALLNIARHFLFQLDIEYKI